VATTRRHKIRAVKDEENRRALSIRGKAEYIFDLIDEIGELDPTKDHFAAQMQQKKTQAELRLKMLAKTLPDLKQVDADLTSSDGSMSPPTVIELVAKALD
jgi:hypothetical protein